MPSLLDVARGIDLLVVVLVLVLAALLGLAGDWLVGIGRSQLGDEGEERGAVRSGLISALAARTGTGSGSDGGAAVDLVQLLGADARPQDALDDGDCLRQSSRWSRGGLELVELAMRGILERDEVHHLDLRQRGREGGAERGLEVALGPLVLRRYDFREGKSTSPEMPSDLIRLKVESTTALSAVVAPQGCGKYAVE